MSAYASRRVASRKASEAERAYHRIRRDPNATPAQVEEARQAHRQAEREYDWACADAYIEGCEEG